MRYLAEYVKRPTAIETIAVEFTSRVPTGQAATSFDVDAYDSTGADVTATLILASSRSTNRVTATLQSGTDQRDYYVVFALVCDGDERPEETIKVQVRA